ncbi:MAG: CHASE domain-containing protein [Opitutaceae bacterium]
MLVIVLYVCFAQYGLLVSDIDHLISPIWPPFGLVIASVFLAHRKLLPGIFLGALAAQLIAGNYWTAALTISLGVTTSAIIAFFTLRLADKFKSLIGRALVPFWIISVSLIAALISASFGTFALFTLELSIPDVPYESIWLTWWMGDATGALIIAPVIIHLRKFMPSIKWLIQLSVLIIIGGATFSWIFMNGANSTPLLFLVFPVLLIACQLFGPAGSAWTTLSFVVFSIASSFLLHPTSELNSFPETVLLFDFFVFALAVTSLSISTFYQKKYDLLPALLFLIGWSFCGWLHYSLNQNNQKLDDARFQEIANEAAATIEHRLEIYTDALRASAGYYMNSEQMERHEWRNYVTYVDIPRRYLGINGLGFIRPFSKTELDSYVADIVANELPDFSIKQVPNATPPPPDYLGYEHYIITHIEPIEDNREALGLNVASEINRKSAAERARDSGNTTMTGRITLVQDGKSRPGFLIYLPIYKAGKPIDTIGERRAAFVGWAYAPFVTENFLKGVLGSRANQIHYDIFDSDALSSDSFVWGSFGNSSISNKYNYDYVSYLELAGQTFGMGWNRGPEFQKQQGDSATIAAASLALGTCLLVGIVISLRSTNRRVNSIVATKTLELVKANSDLHKEVNERKRLETEAEEAQRAAEAASYAKSEFLATMSHEIRTPMNSVIGFAELLATSKLNAEQASWTDYIRSSSHSLLHIINDILDISKIEAGKLNLERIPFSMNDVIAEIVGSFTAVAAEKGIQIKHEEKGNAPTAVYGDPIRIKQIITNLVSNAFKFTKRGSITISTAWEGDDKSGHASIHIVDTGIGIPNEKLHTLFNKFTQADSSTTRRFGGTGLGLAICKQLVDMMGGTIHVESTENVGTIMTVKLHFEFHTSGLLLKKAPREPFKKIKSEPNHAAPSILLVDDNAVNQKLGLTILQRFGCTVSLAANGALALEHLKNDMPSIIFMDCQMPVKDGFQTTIEIRELERKGELKPPPHSDHIIIIALTANASHEDRQACLDVGMNDYMRKPCGPKDFRAMLDKYWTQKQQP